MSGSLSNDKSAPEKPRRSIARRAVGAVGALGFLAGVGALGATALGAIYAAAQLDTTDPTPPLPVAVDEIALSSAYQATETYLGRVEAARETALGFEAGGEVVAVFVDEGDAVLEGEAIARLDTAALEARRDQLEAERTRLEADLALAERTRARQDALSGDGFASEQRADEARTAETTTAAAIAATDAQLRLVEIEIRKSTVRAPFDGVIAARRIDPGAIVSPGQTIVEILEAGRPQARIGVSPESAERLVIGDRYDIILRGRPTTGELIIIRPDLDPTTRTVAAIFDLEISAATARTLASAGGAEADALGAPMVATFGEVARLELPLEVRARGAWVPISALQEDAKGLWRLLTIAENADGEPIVAAQSVQALYVAGERVFVAGAIEDGAPYIVEGVNRVVIGDVVAPQPAR